MKIKIISVILILTFVTSLLPASLTFASGSDDILIYETFDNYPTNGQDFTSIKANGIDARIIERSGTDKAIYAKAWNDKAKITANLSNSSSLMVFETDIKLSGEKSTAKLFSLTCGQAVLTPITLDGGVVKLADGKEVCGLRYDNWYTLSVKINFAAGTIDVYLDGKMKVGGWYLPSQNYANPTAITWDLSSPDIGYSDISLDNIKIYNGGEFLPQSAFPTIGINNEVLDFTETTEMSESTKVIGITDFNDKGSSGVQNKSSKWEWIKENDTNGYMQFSTKATTTEDPFMDTTFPELANESKYVIEAMIRPKEIKGSSYIEFMDGKDNARSGWAFGARLDADGGIYTRTELTRIGSWRANAWQRLIICVNVSSGTMDFWYALGDNEPELLLKGHPTSDVYFPTQYRICAQVKEGGNIGFDIDNIKVYQGTKPRNVGGEDVSTEVGERKTVMDTPERVKPLIGNTVIFMPGNEMMYINGEKKSYSNISNKPYTSNGTFMIPLTLADEITGTSSKWNSVAGSAIIDDKWTVTTGSTVASSPDKTVTMSRPAELINGVLYLPVRNIIVDMLGKSLQWDDRGFMVISDTKFKYEDSDNFYKAYEQIDQIYRYMLYDRPSGEEMTAAVKLNHPNKSHPRLMYTDEAASVIKQNIALSANNKAVYDKLITSLDKYLVNGAGEYFDANTPDSNKQTQGLDAMNAIEQLSIAYQVTGDNRYLDVIVDIMDILCAYDNLGQWTSLLATGHWTAAFGLGYDITYNYLNATDEGRAKLKNWRDRAYALAYPNLITTYESATGYRWYNILDNFGVVIGTGHMMMLLALADEEDHLADTQYLMENVMKSIEYSASFYGPDGAWYEGLSYWNYATSFYVCLYESLKNSCGNIYGFEDIQGIMNAGYTMLYGVTPYGMFNFHDTDESHENDVSPYMFAHYSGNSELGKAWSRMYSQQFEGRDDLFNARQLLWYDASYETADDIDLPLDRYFRGTEFGTMRSSWESTTPTFVGIHGGFTGLPHDMLDIGEFVFEDDGVRWAKDLGNDSYSLPNYWANDGYYIYRKNPQGENCLVINPRADYYGMEVGAGSTLKFFESKPKAAMAAYDLSALYAQDANKVVRGYYFGDDRHTLTIRDEIELKKKDSEVYWFMHTPGTIAIDGNNATISYAGKKLQVEVLCDADSFELLDMAPKALDMMPEIANQGANSGRKLAVKAVDSGNFSITVKLSPVRDDYTITPAEDKFIDEWTLPDGEIVPSLTLSSVFSDGVTVDGFNPAERTIEINVPVNQTEFPVLTATASEGTIAVEYGAKITDGAKITVSAPGKKMGIYHVKFTFDQNREITITDALSPIAPIAGLGSGNIIEHIAWYCNAIPQAANGPDNLFDRSFETRWASNVDGGYVELDFGEVKDISGVAYAIYDGAARKNNFEILYSEDGINYKRVYNGQSLGTTAEFERLHIPGKARFVRYVGHGATSGIWNSVLEFGAYVGN